MKSSHFWPICLALLTSGSANCQLSTPSVGYVRYMNDGVRGVYGLEGNYIVGRDVLALAETASFSDDGGLIFQSGSLTLVDSKLTALSTTPVAGSDPIVRVDGNLQTAIAWVPASRVLVHWNGESFVSIAVPGLSEGDTVTSVRKLDSSTASLLVQKQDSSIVRDRVSLRTGEFKSSTLIPAASGSAFEDGTRIVCFKDGRLSVLSQTGELLQAFSIPADDRVLVEQVSSRCLHFSTKTPGQDWLLHTDGNDLHLYKLPAPKKDAKPVSGANSGAGQ